MKLLLTLGSLLAAGGSLLAGPLGYSLTGTAQYTPGCGSGDQTVGQCGGPDTGWLSIRNTGSSDFIGTATFFGIAPSQTINLSITGTLAPGQTWVFNAGPESSNQGGYDINGPIPSGNVDSGLQFSMSGILDGDAFAASILDSEIHSGVFRTNPFGVTLDNYILQGGDPLGRDTGDLFEETQAPGTFVWQSQAADAPEPGAIMLLGSGLAALALQMRKRR